MTRRVGTFTLGVSLIVIGVIIPLALIYPDSAMRLIQLSPLLLVGLGVEILFYAITVKQDGTQKLRYDGLSIFIVICISVVTIGASFIVPLVRNYSTIYRETKEIRNEVETKIYDKMASNDYEGDLSIYESTDDFYYMLTGGKADYVHVFNLNMRLYFDETKTKDESTTAIYKMINDLDERVDYVSVTVETKDGDYYCNLNGGMLKNVTEEIIKSHIRFEDTRERMYDDYGRPYDASSDVVSSDSDSSDASSEQSSDISSETSSEDVV